MKVQYHFNEVLAMLAQEHNTGISNIEIINTPAGMKAAEVYSMLPEQLGKLITAALENNKLSAIKIIRELTGLGLKESKDVADAGWATASADKLNKW